MTIDLQGISLALIAGVFSILGIVLPLLINARIKDAQAATALGAAVKNSLGAVEQAATQAVRTYSPAVTIPGVPASLEPGVQYVLDHAGQEAARFGITPEAIAAKIDAQIGLAKIAAAASVATLPAVVRPLPGALAQAPLSPASAR